MDSTYSLSSLKGDDLSVSSAATYPSKRPTKASPSDLTSINEHDSLRLQSVLKLKQCMRMSKHSVIEVNKLNLFTGTLLVASGIIKNSQYTAWTKPINLALIVENYSTLLIWVINTLTLEPALKKCFKKKPEEVNSILFLVTQLFQFFHKAHTARAILSKTSFLASSSHLKTHFHKPQTEFAYLHPIRHPEFFTDSLLVIKPDEFVCSASHKASASVSESKTHPINENKQFSNIAKIKTANIIVLLSQVNKYSFILDMNFRDFITYLKETQRESQDRYDHSIPKRDKYVSTWLKENKDWVVWGLIMNETLSLAQLYFTMSLYDKLVPQFFTKEQANSRWGFLTNTVISLLLSTLISFIINRTSNKAFSDSDSNTTPPEPQIQKKSSSNLFKIPETHCMPSAPIQPPVNANKEPENMRLDGSDYKNSQQSFLYHGLDYEEDKPLSDSPFQRFYLTGLTGMRSESTSSLGSKSAQGATEKATHQSKKSQPPPLNCTVL